MRLAAAAAVEVPLHGLLFASDGSLSYFIKRFDRTGRKYKLPVEDFAQLLGRDRDTKYDSSMEQVADVIMQFCTFPVLEAVKLLRIVLVNYLLGNEDGHLKNFSLITRDQKVELSPAYDLVNSSIAIANPTEEIALPIRGRKRNLSRSLFLNYFAGERLGLNSTSIEAVLREISVAFAQWDRLISNSFLSQAKKKSFLDLLLTRKAVLGF
jgi:serine/threonine-protein kinase HipA